MSRLTSPWRSCHRVNMSNGCLRSARDTLRLGGTVGLVVDPEGETVYDIRPSEPLRVLRGDDPIDLEPVLPDFSLTVRALFDSMVDDWLLEPDPAEQLPRSSCAPGRLPTLADTPLRVDNHLDRLALLLERERLSGLVQRELVRDQRLAVYLSAPDQLSGQLDVSRRPGP